VVSNTYCAVFYVLFVFVLCLVYSGVQHILCCVFCFVCLRQTKNTTQYVLDTTIHKTQDEDKQNIKHSTICVGHHYTQNVLCLVHSGVQHILCCVLCFVCLRLVSCVYVASFSGLPIFDCLSVFSNVYSINTY
jgi:hypothetical protein